MLREAHTLLSSSLFSHRRLLLLLLQCTPFCKKFCCDENACFIWQSYVEPLRTIGENISVEMGVYFSNFSYMFLTMLCLGVVSGLRGASSRSLPSLLSLPSLPFLSRPAPRSHAAHSRSCALRFSLFASLRCIFSGVANIYVNRAVIGTEFNTYWCQENTTLVYSGSLSTKQKWDIPPSSRYLSDNRCCGMVRLRASLSLLSRHSLLLSCFLSPSLPHSHHCSTMIMMYR